MTDHDEPKPTLHSIIGRTLNDYDLSNMTIKGSSEAYPLVDLLSNDGCDISTGRAEIACIADEVACRLLDHAPASPIRQVQEALGVGTMSDAALNLEGAIDTLLIADKRSEDDTVVRTMRRVLAQIHEAARVAELGQVVSIAD